MFDIEGLMKQARVDVHPLRYSLILRIQDGQWQCLDVKGPLKLARKQRTMNLQRMLEDFRMGSEQNT